MRDLERARRYEAQPIQIARDSRNCQLAKGRMEEAGAAIVLERIERGNSKIQTVPRLRNFRFMNFRDARDSARKSPAGRGRALGAQA